MHISEPFNIAFSYEGHDGWIARDLHELLSAYGLRVYCYDRMPDHARGILRSKLREIYQTSWMNVLFWSQSYAAQRPPSFVSMERTFIAHRHVNKGEPDSLLVVSPDNHPLEDDLDVVLAHSLQSTGLLGLERIAIDRLSALSRRPTASGIVCHPPPTHLFRSAPKDCAFTINPRFRQDPYSRWRQLADVWVDFPNEHGTKCVYLIPSGLTTVYLRHTVRLRTEPRYLAAKRAATENWVTSVGTKRLSGCWFLERKDERDVVAVYCGEYDQFLNEHFHEFLPPADAGNG